MTPQGGWLPPLADSWFVQEARPDAVVLENGRTDHQLEVPAQDVVGSPTGGSNYWHPGHLNFRRRVMLSGYRTIVW
jgi:hypothetical protein